MLWAGIVPASPVDGVRARVAAQAWIDGGYAFGQSSGRTVASVDRVAFGTERAHVARLSDGGVVILPTDDRIDPVIAFSPSATELSAEPDSPLSVLLACDLAARMAAATNSPAVGFLSAQTPAQARWAKLLGKSSGSQTMTTAASLGIVSDVRVDSLVTSRWSQRKNSYKDGWGSVCYNYYTPNNYPCGCVATAMAQLMRFHQYPTSATAVTRTCAVGGKEASYTMKGGTYDYAMMPLVPEAYWWASWYESGATEAQRQAIGKLTYDCGVAMQMSWNSGGSSAGGAAAHGPLKDIFGYKNARTTTYLDGLATASYRERVIHTNLDAGFPVMLGINNADNTAGHMILADGYGYSDTITYTHLNMGWANAEDIWYALPNIGTSYGFSVIKAIVYNIFPKESGEIVSGRVVDSSGKAIGGVDVKIKVQGTSSVLKTVTTGTKGIFAFVVPAAKTYVVTATCGVGSFSVTATTGTSVDSQVTLKVGKYSYYSSMVACGNVLCGDVKVLPPPSVEGDSEASITGDAEKGYTISPGKDNTDVVVTIPSGVPASKVTVVVSPSVATVTPNGAVLKVVKGGHDITSYLTGLAPDAQGVVNLAAADVKSEIKKETLDPDNGAEITLNADDPSLTTSETKPGLTYTLYEGRALDAMNSGDSKLGDGESWTPSISVKGGASAFYSIDVSK